MNFVNWTDDVSLADFFPGDMAVLNWLMRPEGTLEDLADELEADQNTVSRRAEEIKSLLQKTVKVAKIPCIKQGRLLEPIFRAMHAKVHKYVKTQVKDKDTGKIMRSVEHFETDDYDVQLKALALLRIYLGPALDKVALQEVAGEYQITEKELAAAPSVPQLPDENQFVHDLGQNFEGRNPTRTVAVDVTDGQGPM